MKLTTNNKTAKLPKSFYTSIKSVIGSINLLSNHQILQEKNKLNNMRNGKVRA